MHYTKPPQRQQPCGGSSLLLGITQRGRARSARAAYPPYRASRARTLGRLLAVGKKARFASGAPRSCLARRPLRFARFLPPASYAPFRARPPCPCPRPPRLPRHPSPRLRSLLCPRSRPRCARSRGCFAPLSRPSARASQAVAPWGKKPLRVPSGCFAGAIARSGFIHAGGSESAGGGGIPPTAALAPLARPRFWPFLFVPLVQGCCRCGGFASFVPAALLKVC